MAFKLLSLLDSLDDLPESVDPRELYTEKNGKFELVGEGIKTPADIDRLNKALVKERDDHKKTKLKVASFGDWTPETIEELETRAAEAEATAGTPGKGRPSDEQVQKLVTIQVDKVKKDLEKQLKVANERITLLTGENTSLTTDKQSRVLKDAVREVTLGEKGIKIRPEAIADVELYAERMFTFGEDGKPVTREGAGVEPGQSVRELITTIQVGGARPHWFMESEGAGAGGGGSKRPGGALTGPNPFDKATFSLGPASAMMKSDPIRAKALIAKAKDPSMAQSVFAHALK
jgi:hypothetical protein